MYIELTILLPCLNEAATLKTCIERARLLLTTHDISGEILVSDNGSTDGSQQIALAAGARLVDCPVRGYGAALQYGIERANGEFIIMGDADDSYHFDEAFPMVEKLREGYDVVMGTRMKGRIMPNAMPKLNRYLGNPVLTFIGQKLFNLPTSDFHCGMRAFRADRARSINLATTGMEWASELVIKSKLNGLKMTEVPVTLYKDGRNRPPHLRRWRDGWRHLRFMLLHAPNALFIMPGMALMSIGLLGQMLLVPGMVRVGSITFGVQTMLICAFFLLTGVQMVFTGLLAKVYCHTSGILPITDRFIKAIKSLTLEKLLVFSLLCGSVGVVGTGTVVARWWLSGHGPVELDVTLRYLIPSLTLAFLSLLGIFNGFVLSILFLPSARTGANIFSDEAVRDEVPRVAPVLVPAGSEMK